MERRLEDGEKTQGLREDLRMEIGEKEDLR